MSWLFNRIAAFLLPKQNKNIYSRGGYEGARMDHRASSFRIEPTGVNSAIKGDIVSLRSRARSLVRNNPLAKRMIDILVCNTIGTGIVPLFQAESQTQRKRLKYAWEKFVDNADARGQVNYYGLQEQAVRSMFESGEVLAVRHLEKNNKNLMFLLLEGDHIDQNKDNEITDKGISKLGVVFDKIGHKRLGYWLFPQHPGDNYIFGQSFLSGFVNSEGIYHLYRARRPGMVRGVPELSSVLFTLRDYADYFESALIKSRIESSYGAFIRRPLEETTQAELNKPFTEGNGLDKERKFYTFDHAPGGLQELSPGEDIQFPNPTSNPNFESFTLHAKMEAAAGVGVTYDQASGDLRQANYSSLRAGKIEFRRMIESIQHNTIIPQFCKPIYNEFLKFALLFGYITENDAKVPIRWITPAWEPIDPKKDLEADLLALRSGRMSYFEYAAAWGQDPVEQLEEIARFNALSDEFGVALDGDPRYFTSAGIRQPEVKNSQMNK